MEKLLHRITNHIREKLGQYEKFLELHFYKDCNSWFIKSCRIY